MKKYITIFLLLLTCLSVIATNINKDGVTNKQSFTPGDIWTDDQGKHINAHGGGVLYHNDTYYWFGENRPDEGFTTQVGVMCYSSKDLYNWKNEGVALPVVLDDNNHPITQGCIIERPKVIYNEKTKKFVMYFHLELKGKGYGPSLVGVAVSDKVTGPYKYVKSSRVNADYWPLNMTAEQQNLKVSEKDYSKWWTPQWFKAVKDGLFIRRDFKGGQMSRDMTLFVDDDKKAYHVYSSEENLTLHIAELTDDYLNYTGKYIRIEPAGHNEAPALFKKDGKYFMITSGCTGWDPNAARLLVADNIMGEWKLYPNPCLGKDSNLTFHSQSTYILPVAGKKDAFIFMADRWNPRSLSDSRYIWLPILFDNGLPVLKWMDNWSLDIFDKMAPDTKAPAEIEGWNLVWSDEFNKEGKPESSAWSYEQGFVRNNELQWYQSDNSYCKDGVLTIYGKKEKIKNPNYEAESKEWRKNREYAEYTATSIKSVGKKEFLYGRFEIRARIPYTPGAWPAIWTLGNSMEWPSCGEIDILELYQVGGKPHILANTVWGTERRYDGAWDSAKVPLTHFTEKDPEWVYKFHVWRMDWDEEAIRLYVDDELVNETLLKDTKNGSLGDFKNPFKQPHYILLNLAIGSNGGVPDDSFFPLKYEVDYVRVYQKK